MSSLIAGSLSIKLVASSSESTSKITIPNPEESIIKVLPAKSACLVVANLLTPQNVVEQYYFLNLSNYFHLKVSELILVGIKTAVSTIKPPIIFISLKSDLYTYVWMD